MARPKRPALKRRFTELFVRRLKSRDVAYLVWDAHQRGLAIRVQPSGARAWKCVYSRHGRPRWLHLGDAAAIGLADARMLAAEAMLAVARGGDPAADRRAERGAGTFAELAERYVEQHAKKKNRSWAQADALVRRHALPRWGKLQASSITRADVKGMMTRIQALIVANQTLAAVSAIFSWSVTEDILATNPCKLVARNPTKSRERILAESEIPKFWKAFDDAGLVIGAALKMILLSGQRPGEVAHMRREHMVDGCWEMPGEPVPAIGWPGTKNGAGHRIWLPAPAQTLLAELGDDRTTGFVFAGARGTPIGKFDAAMRAICAELGVERATPHDLRRTHGTTIAALGFGRDAMNRIQNHKEGGISTVYDRHQYADEIKHTMEAVAARIMALAEGHPETGNILTFGR
jgi:integrase